jgi:DNA-binding LacI/PurR family transcriptional regulator
MIEDFISRIKIDKTSPMPLYYQLLEQIKLLIINGSMEAGTRISTERELMAQLNLSYNTVTRALRELVQEGLLEREQGRGTFVAERRQQHKTVAVVTPLLYQQQGDRYHTDRSLSSHFAHIIEPQLVRAIEAEAKAFGANVLLYLDNSSVDIERENFINLIQRKVDAAIVLSIGSNDNDDCLLRIQEANIPLVLVDRYSEFVHTNYVGSDNFSGTVNAVNILIENGFQTIHYITPELAVTSLKERIAGYDHAINKHGLEFHINTIPLTLITDSCIMQAYELTRQLLQDNKNSIAFFTANSEALTGVVSAIEDSNIDYNNIALASFDDPNIPIPSGILFVEVMQALDEIGKTSVRLAMDVISSNEESRHIKLEPGIRVLNQKKCL